MGTSRRESKPPRSRTDEAGSSRPSAQTPDTSSALAPTLIEWMPLPRTEPLDACPVSHELPASGVARRAAPDPLEAVGLRAGELVEGTYRIQHALGSGGMGVVALAYDERLDRRVAVKFVKPSLFAIPEMRTFFHNEARAMARVSHPNVLQVYAFGQYGETPYFVMEYVEGRTVERWLCARPPSTFPDLDVAVRILDQACQGVDAIHTASTVHRDIKPSNLLIDESFRVAVGDLGVARILESAAVASFVVGSASYMSPEAALGEDEAPELASRRDIYALGCLAYELFTGRPPFVGTTDLEVLSQHVLRDAPTSSSLRPGLSPAFDKILLRAISKDPNNRYATAAAFRRAVLAEHEGTRDPDRILVADDDPDWRSVVVAALAARFPGAHIDAVADGAAAIEAFERHPYSVVLVDLEMPALDGASLTLRLRADANSEHTPIIVLTAAGGPREWQRLAAIGADAFLVKPVDADDVELVIRRTLRSRRGGGPPSSNPMR